MQKKQINTAGVKKLLPHGAIKEIAKRSKTSIFTVSRVLRGGSSNTIVLKTMKEYIEEINELDSQINALVTESNTISQ